jgi:hypothetical protein
MRFLGKYELLEQLTVGSVETFGAYHVGGGKRLLVDGFALPAFINTGLKNSDLLSYMEAMSPPALGAVVDAGRYDDGSQSFIVTKFPRDLAALSKWIEAYKSSSKKKDTTTVEAPVRQLWEGSSGSAEPSATAPEAPVGEFTRAFQGMGPSPKAAKPKSATDAFDSFSPTATPEIVDRAVRLDPYVSPKGELSELTGGLGEGARLPRSSSAPEPLARPEIGRGSIDSTGPIPWDVASEPPSQDQFPSTARAGEFTMFFKGPMAAPSAPSLPDPQPEQESEPFQPMTPPAKGEFTQMFGGPTAGRSSPVPAEPLLEPPAQVGDFTDIFGRSPAPAPPPVVPPPMHLKLEAESSGQPLFSEEEEIRPLPVTRNVPEPAFPADTALESSVLGRSHDDGATRVFRPPVQEVAEPITPPGESEYTKIISAKAKPAASEAAVQKQAPAGGGGAKLSIPLPAALPHLPSMTVPPMTVPQPIPAVHVPTPPAIPAPKLSLTMPASPKPGKKSGWAAYAPLIVILNLLLLAAVSLVLYFILKH